MADRLVAVDVPGFRGSVAVTVDGGVDGPVLLLLHGFCGSGRSFDRLAPLLAGAARVVRVDLLGHGRTGGPAADAPLQARALASVLEALDLDTVTVVGHSFGADVAVALAERSARVTRLVILLQGPDYVDATLPRGRAVMTVPVLGAVVHRTAHLAGTGLDRLARRGDREFAAQRLRDFGAVRSAMFRTVLVERRDRLAARPLDAQVGDLAAPTLVVLGERDGFYGARSAPRYRAAGARVEVLPDARHSAPTDAPARLAGLIVPFATERARD